MTEHQDERLAEIKRRAEAATPGPWRQDGEGYAAFRVVAPVVDNGDGTYSQKYPAQVAGRLVDVDDDGNRLGSVEDEWYCCTLQDAEFVSHSRTDVPYLLERVERAERASAAWKATTKRYRMMLGIHRERIHQAEAALAALRAACIFESDYGYSCHLCCESGPEPDAIEHETSCELYVPQQPAASEEGHG